MTEQVVHSETAGGVCTVTLDDPERKNALSAQLTSELMDALDAAEADATIAAGGCDAVSFGRHFLATPDLVARISEGRTPERFDLTPEVEAGLTFRSLADATAATLEYHYARPVERQQNFRAGLSAEREVEVLAAWHARNG